METRRYEVNKKNTATQMKILGVLDVLRTRITDLKTFNLDNDLYAKQQHSTINKLNWFFLNAWHNT